jgi:hypothetical protein
MPSRQSAAKPWHKPCSRCKKETFVDLLDDDGLCDYCREMASMKVSAGKGRKGQKEQGARGSRG